MTDRNKNCCMLVYQFVEESTEEYGDSIAVVYENKSITYKQLFAQVTDLSNAILHYAKNEQYIGISATRSIEMIIGVLAILKAGKTYLPLDTKYPPLRLQQLIEDSNIKFTLCLDDESEFFEALHLSPIISNKKYHLHTIEIPFYSPVVCVLYTSGSTGKPKGVCLGHQGLINQIKWQQQNGIAKPGVKTLQYCHLSFDAAFQEIFVSVATGGTLYIVNDTYRLNTGNLLHYIIDNNINRLFLPYAVVQFLAEISQLYKLYPTSLQEIITGGELLRITPQIAKFFHTMSHCILMNVYGPTEASIWVTELKLKGNALEWPAIPSIGSPAVGAQLFIADEKLNLLSDGEVGEILIHGDCLALEYLNKPEQTAERFINWNHPKLGAIRVYRTGDLAAYNNDGTLQFHGRRDGQVKIRGGNRVELGEIEVVISNIAGISQVKVIVREDKPNQKIIVAYVLLADNTLTEDAIKKDIAAHLPDYMIPSAVVIVTEFPLTVSGKIDALALPAPEHNLELDINFKAPTTKTEIYLKELWEDLLQLKNISINDNFFEIGGNSLFAIQMMIRIEKNTGKELPLVSVFDHSTIESLAELIDDADTTYKFSPLVAIKSSGKRPPVYLIHGDGLNVINFNGIARHIHPDQPVYGLQPKGIDGKSEALETIEAIAQYYNQAIIQQNPIGPYAIVGYSFGGYVALEMVKQLKQMGRPVLMLGMFDTNVLNAENFLGWHRKLGRKLMRQFPKLMWIIRSFIDNPKAVLEYQFTSLTRRIRHTFNIGTRPINPEIEVYYRLMDKINEKHYNALLKYKLEKYDGKVVMFKAMVRPYFVDDFKYLGWQKYALQGVEVHDIPGDHFTMFAEPNCQTLAKEIDAALLNAKK